MTQEEWIAKALAEAPPLTAEQRCIIRNALAPVLDPKERVAKKEPGLSAREREKVARIFKKDPK